MTNFSSTQPTIEQAQALHEFSLFSPAAVFKTAEGYVMGLLREQNSPPHETAAALEKHGLIMVSACDPICGIWKPYQKAAK